jgi:hypothetical protein
LNAALYYENKNFGNQALDFYSLDEYTPDLVKRIVKNFQAVDGVAVEIEHTVYQSAKKYLDNI